MLGSIHAGGPEAPSKPHSPGTKLAPEAAPAASDGAEAHRAATSFAAVRIPPAGPGGESAFRAQSLVQGADRDAAPDDSAGKDDGADKAFDRLSEEEKREVRDLQARDREVRAHEAAHKAAGGRFAGAARFTYEQGPDGRRYASGGEVSIDAGAVPNDPEATIEKLRTVKRAALAPAEPSAQDQRVARRAEAGIRKAQVERARKVREGDSEDSAPQGTQELQGAQNGAVAQPAPKPVGSRISVFA